MFFQPAAEAKIAHIDVADIARVAAKVLTEEGHVGKAYDLSGPEAWRKSAVEMGIPELYADALVDLNRFYKDDGMAVVLPAVEAITGKKPRTFHEFGKDNVSSFR
jgi:uncharacterized protein YbjT (DUF2867 family)